MHTKSLRTWKDYSPCEICLVNPPWITKKDDIWHGIKAAMPPIGLLSIASYLEAQGMEVAIIDAHVEKLSPLDLKQRIAQLHPRMVGITVMTATVGQAHLIAKLVKESVPAATVVMGGVHATVLPEECLSNRAVDIVVRGDGEFTFHQLCEAILNDSEYDNLSGISFRRADGDGLRVINNRPAAVIRDLNQLPMPGYHLVPLHRYYPAMGAYRRLPAINMLMTRGCPGNCSFCNSARTPLRTRDAELVVNEIIKLQKQYGIREIQFYDDTFTINRNNVLKFCALIKEKKLDITWTAFVRVDTINIRMVRAMKEAGCHQFSFGIESGDQEILKKIGKPIQLGQTLEAVRMVSEAGIEVRAAFIYGCEGETVASMQKTLDFAIELDPDLAMFNIATPNPGTRLYRWAKENGYLMHENWSEYELGNPVINLPTVSPEKIVEFYQKSYKIFYRRPKIMWKRIRKASTISHWLDMIKAFFFIMLRWKLGPRGDVRNGWTTLGKEDLFDYPFYQAGHLQVPLSGKSSIGVYPNTGSRCVSSVGRKDSKFA